MGVTRELLAVDITAAAFAAAPEASATESGISLGEVKCPAANTPGLVVSSGENSPILQKPYLLSSIPRTSLSSSVPFGGIAPTARTTRPNSF